MINTQRQVCVCVCVSVCKNIKSQGCTMLSFTCFTSTANNCTTQFVARTCPHMYDIGRCIWQVVRGPRSEIIDSSLQFYISSFLPLTLTLLSLWHLQLLSNTDAPVNTLNKPAAICRCMSHSIFTFICLFFMFFYVLSVSMPIYVIPVLSIFSISCLYLSLCLPLAQVSFYFPFLSVPFLCLPDILSFCLLSLTVAAFLCTLLSLRCSEKTASLSPCTFLSNLLFVTVCLPTSAFFSSHVSVCHSYL